MTRDDLKVPLPRWATVLAIIVSLLTIVAFATSAADGRYVKRTDYQADVLQIKADLRVLRCKVAQDCP